MKYFRFCLVILALSAFAGISGCKKDATYMAPTENTDSLKGTFAMNISALVRGQGFVINSPFYDVNSYKYNLSTFKFYISHLSLIRQDNTLEEVDTVFLADYDLVAFGQPVVIKGKIPAGSYKGVKFWIGLDSVYNAKDATIYGSGDPLSIYQSTYWDWNSGYRFIMIDGATDSVVGNTNTASQPQKPMSYHVGTNSMYTSVEMPAHQITITKQQQTDYNVALDVNKIFYSSTDTVVMYRTPFTHTMDHMDIATKVIGNMGKAFSEQ